MTAIEMTKQALVLQDKTQESTSRAKKALEETIEVYLFDLDWYQCQSRIKKARRENQASGRRT